MLHSYCEYNFLKYEKSKKISIYNIFIFLNSLVDETQFDLGPQNLFITYFFLILLYLWYLNPKYHTDPRRYPVFKDNVDPDQLDTVSMSDCKHNPSNLFDKN